MAPAWLSRPDSIHKTRFLPCIWKPHDIVIQNGTHHGWRNKTDKPATIAFVVIGAGREATTR